MRQILVSNMLPEHVSHFPIATGISLLAVLGTKIDKERKTGWQAGFIAHEAQWNLRRDKLNKMNKIELLRRDTRGQSLAVCSVAYLIVIFDIGDKTIRWQTPCRTAA